MRQLVQDFPGDRLAVLGLPALGRNVPPVVAEQVMPGIRTMRDSLTYQATADAPGEIRDPERLRRLAERVGRAASWDDLLNAEHAPAGYSASVQ
jgi:hypothetical protein